jgi:hypothetical protein
VLDALGGGQQLGIYGNGADRGADLAHGFANRVEKGVAGNLIVTPKCAQPLGIDLPSGTPAGPLVVDLNYDPSSTVPVPGKINGQVGIGVRRDRTNSTQKAALRER